MMDIDAILAPIQDDNPAGEDLRYNPIYDEIKEARREDETFGGTNVGREVKQADWNSVIKLTTNALTSRTKDLQIAVWLTEALIIKEGFKGLSMGLRILKGFLSNFWETVYPLIEDDDLDFRIGPIEFMNDKLSITIKQIPLTDPGKTPGYSLLKYEESRQVGFEKDILNQYGDVDEGKKKARDELIAEGKITAENFDSAVNQSSSAFYTSLIESLMACEKDFAEFDKIIDDKFGDDSPRLSELREALEAHKRLGFLKEFLIGGEISESESLPESEEPEVPVEEEREGGEVEEVDESPQPIGAQRFPAGKFSDFESLEKSMWQDALKKFKDGGIKKALDQLYRTSSSMPSVREKNRYRLLIAKLCLKAERPDLARPILEELYALIEELQLGRWESPMWIAEVFETLYQCLTAGEPSDDDMGRAQELFRRICTMDVTKAMMYRT